MTGSGVTILTQMKQQSNLLLIVGALRETAFDYAFLLTQFGMAN